MKVYISGPITHHVGEDPFAPVKARLEAMGYETLNPKDVPACPDKSCARLPHEIEKKFEHSWACFLRYDLAAMLRECDTIVMLDGWQDSHGARLEMSTAAAVGMNILFAKDLNSIPQKGVKAMGNPDAVVTPLIRVTQPEPEIHVADINPHANHWDVSCLEPRCSWTAVNVSTRAYAETIAQRHEEGW